MNLVEMYVENITLHRERDGLHYIKADFYCYGRTEIQVVKCLTEKEWESIWAKGYYLV